MLQREKAAGLRPNGSATYKRLAAIEKPESALRLDPARRHLRLRESGYKFRLLPARFIPQRKFDAVPESELVIDDTKIILHHMLGCADSIGHVSILQALGN
jgi:hypothetical protein